MEYLYVDSSALLDEALGILQAGEGPIAIDTERSGHPVPSRHAQLIQLYRQPGPAIVIDPHFLTGIGFFPRSAVSSAHPAGRAAASSAEQAPLPQAVWDARSVAHATTAPLTMSPLCVSPWYRSITVEAMLASASEQSEVGVAWQRFATWLNEQQWLLHAGTTDFPCLLELGLSPTRFWDTQLAALMVTGRFQGLSRLLHEYCGLEDIPELGASAWHERPLGEDLLAYAVSDVLHLPALHEYFELHLRAQGVWEIYERECRHQMRMPVPTIIGEWWRGLPNDRAEVLDSAFLTRYRCLALARMTVALEADQQAKIILPDEGLVALASAVDPAAWADQAAAQAPRRQRARARTLGALAHSWWSDPAAEDAMWWELYAQAGAARLFTRREEAHPREVARWDATVLGITLQWQVPPRRRLRTDRTFHSMHRLVNCVIPRPEWVEALVRESEHPTGLYPMLYSSSVRQRQDLAAALWVEVVHATSRQRRNEQWWREQLPRIFAQSQCPLYLWSTIIPWLAAALAVYTPREDNLTRAMRVAASDASRVVPKRRKK